MNTAVAKHTMKRCIQTLKDEQRRQYHLTHDCFTGRPLTEWQLSRQHEETTDAVTQKRQQDLACLNRILYPTPTLGSVFGESLTTLKQQPETPEPNLSAPFTRPSEDLVNRAIHWFDQYRTVGLSALLPDQAQQLTERNIAIIKRAFAPDTVLIQNACLLSAFWIRSPLDWKAAGKTSLLEHLFVQYKTPAFLQGCWSEAANEDSVRWLLCYLMYAQGGSLKALTQHFGWTPLSKKLWHQLFLCPAKLNPLQAVLYAEFKRLGGWDEDFSCLMANEAYVIDLLEPVSEAGRDFWYDTCRWTIKHQFELTAEENQKVLRWARHQLTEFTRQGDTYRLQGRSKAKILDSIAAYEREQRDIQRARARLAERARQVSMAREAERERLREEYLEEQAMREALLARQRGDYDYDEPIDVSWRNRGWDWMTNANGKKWHFAELTTSQQLNDEGEAMEHCVGGYSLSCLDGTSAIFSLRVNGSRKVTIEIDPLCKHLIQVQGKFNAEPDSSIQAMLTAWMKRVVTR
ncbi:MAG: PcfJ domain-containing protein [Thiolinea sp.]